MDLEDDVERMAGAENNVSDSNVFFYVMLTLVFLLSVLAISLSIWAYVRATSQQMGPQGPPGPPGEIPVADLFEQPAFYISSLTYTIGNDPLTQPRFLVFLAQAPDNISPIQVLMPPAALYNGKIFRVFVSQNNAGLKLEGAAGEPDPIPAAFNPILRGYLAFVTSDGSAWIINSSTIEVTFGTGTG